jgi:hypothetical protein
MSGTIELRYLDVGQARVIVQWKNRAVEETRWKEWCEKHVDARKKIQEIFNQADFFKGKDLNQEEISEIFKQTIRGQGGRALNSTLYTENSLKSFNSALRRLLYEDDHLPKRFENFLNLKGAGIWTTSQLLCKWYPRTHPFVGTVNGTGFMDEVLFNKLTTAQLKSAQDDAIEYYQTKPRFFSSKTLKYLTYAMILREIRDFIGLESFLEIQNVLWHAQEKPSILKGPVKSKAAKEEEQGTQRKGMVSIPSVEQIAESSRWAVRKVEEYEKLQGRVTHDVSDRPRGYDIESVDKNTGEVRYIEVKSHRGSFLVALTDNEYKAAERLDSNYFLYVVTFDNIFIIRNPCKVCTIDKNLITAWNLTDWFEKGERVGFP